MTSAIDPTKIDITYPVAGADNDSQGFRDNFTNLRNNDAAAKAEIEDLQNKVVLKSALTGGGAVDNSMSGTTFLGAQFRDNRYTRVDRGTVVGALSLNYRSAHYQVFATNGAVTLAFTNWPSAGQFGWMRLEIVVNDPSHTVSLPATSVVNADGATGVIDKTITFDDAGTYLIEISTRDAGSTLFVVDLTRGPNHVRSYRPSADRTTTNSSYTTITGLSFNTAPNGRYEFEATIPFTHSLASGATHSFAVQFSAGTCNYTVEQQTTASSEFTIRTATSTNSSLPVATTAEADTLRMCRIRGTFTHSSATTVDLRFATSSGTLTVRSTARMFVRRID